MIELSIPGRGDFVLNHAVMDVNGTLATDGRLLKGVGHPMFPQEERRYLVASVRHVARAYISTGEGWLDAEPEFGIIQPDIYAVNEDGDKPEKREFCERNGIQYVVLRRTPRAGLPARKSTNLRGF